MRDLTSSRLIKLKGFLFLFLAVASAVLLLLERPNLRTAALLTLVVWSSCRFYYFAFYVLEHYVDPTFRYSGLLSLAKHLRR
jgi:hypothetical protein